MPTDSDLWWSAYEAATEHGARMVLEILTGIYTEDQRRAALEALQDAAATGRPGLGARGPKEGGVIA